MKKIILFLLFIISICLGFWLSWDSIPNQEGYAELSWKFSHIDFNIIFNPAIMPLILLVPSFLEHTLHISIANAWKIMDLFFASCLFIFFTFIYWKKHVSKTFTELITPVLVIFSSLGFLYSFTSMSGEGMPLFFAVLGLYFLHNKSFVLASICFIISFLSKFTVYLITPGIIIWLMFNAGKYSKKEIKQILIAGLIFISVFLIYHSIKNWTDIKLQLPYITNLTFTQFRLNLFYFLFAMFLQSPIVIIFSFLNLSFSNLFWLAGLSSLLMLTRRYFYWNHPQQIVTFWMLYFFIHPKSAQYVKFKYLFIQTLLSLILVNFLPLKFGNTVIFPKHMTISESLEIDKVILNDYHGGKVGYYLNRRFDEPFPTYEISYMDPSWDFVIEDTEYIVVPKELGVPQQMVNFKHCQYTFYKQLGVNSIYKVKCNTNK